MTGLKDGTSDSTGSRCTVSRRPAIALDRRDIICQTLNEITSRELKWQYLETLTDPAEIAYGSWWINEK